MEIQVGQTWRSNLGGPLLRITGVDETMAYVKRADSPKKDFATRGGTIVALSEFKDWKLIEDAPAMLER